MVPQEAGVDKGRAVQAKSFQISLSNHWLRTKEDVDKVQPIVQMGLL